MAIEELQRSAAAWGEVQHIVIPDTSLLIHHPAEIDHITWPEIAESRMDRIDVVIPTVVIEELDLRKEDKGGKTIAPGVPGDTRSRAPPHIASHHQHIHKPDRCGPIGQRKF